MGTINNRHRAPTFTVGDEMFTPTLNSKLFWKLIDRWKVEDTKALQIIGHAGTITEKGTDPGLLSKRIPRPQRY